VAGRPCSSYRFCGGDVAPDAPATELFCPDCRVHLENVKSRSVKPPSRDRIAAEVKVSRISQWPVGRRANREQAGPMYRERILDALKQGPLLSFELIAAIDAAPDDRTASRARNALKREGLIVEIERVGRNRRYALPEAA
jgi:DNA-binding transcriptional ArsR family regulator